MAFISPIHLIEKMYIKEGSTVADFGAGSGAYTLALSEVVGKKGKVYALDIHRDMLETMQASALKMGLENIETIWTNIEKETPLESYTQDAVVVSNVLFQVEDCNAVIQEVSRVIKPLGMLLCVEWSASHMGIGPHPSHVIEQARAEEMLVKHGFSIKERLPAGSYHYAMLAIKL